MKQTDRRTGKMCGKFSVVIYCFYVLAINLATRGQRWDAFRGEVACSCAVGADWGGSCYNKYSPNATYIQNNSADLRWVICEIRVLNVKKRKRKDRAKT